MIRLLSRASADCELAPEPPTAIQYEAAWAALQSSWTLSHDLFGIPRHWTLRPQGCDEDAVGQCTTRPEYGYVYIGLNVDQIDSIDRLAVVIAHELCHAADGHWLGVMNQMADLLTGTNARAASVILNHACEFAVQQRLQSAPGQELIAHARAAYLAALQENP